MSKSVIDNNYFGTERIGKILLRIAPPVMLAQLIQSLYNIVDSFFVGKYSDDALTALTVVYPLQLIIVALAVGTGVGVNTYMARKYAQEREKEANGTAGAGLILALISWAIFAAVSALIMRPYVHDLGKIPAGDRGCRHIRKYSLHRQSRRFPRGHMVKGASVARQYAPADDSAGGGRADKYRF